ncbi:sensor histidine kinase [Geosporobacter ferrireducens]|nr:ATP-binding protein [Geosporobacter ferrireducens]MTI57918.1 PAS domain S-box protein [Geosporobacter ferrireducens]
MKKNMDRIKKALGLQTLNGQLRFWGCFMIAVLSCIAIISFFYIGFQHEKVSLVADLEVDTEILRSVLDSKRMETSYVDYRETEAYRNYHRTKHGKWDIINKIAKNILLHRFYKQLFFWGTTLIIVFLLLILLILRLSKKIEVPIQYVLQGTEIIQSGDYDFKIEENVIASAPIELRALCKAFNEMSSTISDNMQQLLNSEERYRALFHLNPDAVYTIDCEGNFQDLNQICGKAGGYQREEMLFRSFLDFVSPEDRDKAQYHHERALCGESQNYELAILGKDGRKIYFNITNIPVIMNGQVTGIHGIAKNITQQKLAELELKETTKKLEQSNKDLQEFAYVASHDLQEPLRMVSSYLQLLERRYKGRLDQDADEFIHFAVDGAKRMQKLINDLLTYSRVNTKEEKFAMISSQNMLQKVLDNLSIYIHERNAKVTYDSLPEIYGDETQMIQLLQNLISNGIKFNSHDKPKINISAMKRKAYWVFRIEDNGIGIPYHHQKRIFSIFQRLHTREEYEGTGIGLSICKKIVERHGGQIWLESEVNEGTTFYFSIPAIGGN